MRSKRDSGRRRKQGGFTLITMAFCLIGLVGMLALVVDLGRMYIAKSEGQAYVDAASLAAILELDGTQDGLVRARTAVAANPNRWNFGATAFDGSTVAFAQAPTGPWDPSPTDPRGFRYAQVATSMPVPLFFMPAVAASASGGKTPYAALMLMESTATVSAASASGQVVKERFPEGLFPFSPFAQNTTAPHFGLTPGQQYTLRWASNPKLHNNMCAGDDSQSMIDLAQSSGGDERGFIEESSSDVIRSAIEGDYQTTWRGVGDAVNMTGGAKQAQSTSLVNRVNQDTDSSSSTYTQYLANGVGNGRRIVGVPINKGYPSYTVVQIGAFMLLPPSQYGSGGNKPFCAEYLGAWVQGGRHKAAGDAGSYVGKIIR